MKKTAIKLATRSTAYGIPNYFRKNIRLLHKILWLAFVVASSIGCFWYINFSINDYFNYKVVTVIKSVYEQPAPFPAISFCNYLNKRFENARLKDIIIRLSFGYDENLIQNPENYFDSFHSIDYGRCYRFNRGKNMTNHSVPIFNSNIGGVDDALAIEFKISEGILLWIHNQSSPPRLLPFNNHYSDRLLIPQSFYSQIVIDRQREEQLGSPFSNCLNNLDEFHLNKTIIDYINSARETYSQIKCLELCFELKYIEANPCQCNNTKLGNMWEYCWIGLEKQNHSSCTWLFKKAFYEKNILDECSQYCPPQCNLMSYSIQTTSIDDNKKTRVRIFYRDLTYTLISQEPKYQLQDLISEIGGFCGLFIGISFVSLVELIELITEMIFIFWETRNKLKKDCLDSTRF
jgi:hypothetical protein